MRKWRAITGSGVLGGDGPDLAVGVAAAEHGSAGNEPVSLRARLHRVARHCMSIQFRQPYEMASKYS